MKEGLQCQCRRAQERVALEKHGMGHSPNRRVKEGIQQVAPIGRVLTVGETAIRNLGQPGYPPGGVSTEEAQRQLLKVASALWLISVHSYCAAKIVTFLQERFGGEILLESIEDDGGEPLLQPATAVMEERMNTVQLLAVEVVQDAINEKLSADTAAGVRDVASRVNDETWLVDIIVDDSDHPEAAPLLVKLSSVWDQVLAIWNDTAAPIVAARFGEIDNS